MDLPEACETVLRPRPGAATPEVGTPAGRAVREAIEVATDVARTRVLDDVRDDLDELLVPLGRWAERVVAAGWFPPDPDTRAAG